MEKSTCIGIPILPNAGFNQTILRFYIHVENRNDTFREKVRNNFRFPAKPI
jgi:hypothetical protein